jgi:Spy/CpxP family protein refolding chaperone
MQTRKLMSGWGVVAVVAIVGFSSLAFAGWGRGYGGGYGCGRGAGPDGPGNSDSGPGACWRSGLSDEEVQKLEQNRKAFREATDSLRRQLYAKSLELESELVKEKPDAQQAAALQKEVSTLEGELAQKRIEHQLKMKEINPNAGRGWSGAYRGKGNCPRYGGGYDRP